MEYRREVGEFEGKHRRCLPWNSQATSGRNRSATSVQRERVASRIYAYNTIPYNTMPSLTHSTRQAKRTTHRRDPHARTAVARAALPLRTRLDSASAIAPAVGRRYRPMNSELWQQEPDRWLLAHLLAAPSRSTRHRQGEWSRVARISGGRACVGRTNDRTTRSSAPLHAGRRAERALPLPAGGRKKCARLENFCAAPRLRAYKLQSC